MEPLLLFSEIVMLLPLPSPFSMGHFLVDVSLVEYPKMLNVL
jgi:hypothetical protein